MKLLQAFVILQISQRTCNSMVFPGVFIPSSLTVKCELMVCEERIAFAIFFQKGIRSEY